MMDVAKITDGVVAQVWRDRAIESMPGSHEDLVEFAPGEAVCGMLWDGETLSLPVRVPSTDDYADAVQAHVDAMALSRGYSDGASLAGYASSTVPGWASEAATFVGWRDAVWLYVYGQLAAVLAAERTPPSVEQLIEELPRIEWPD